MSGSCAGCKNWHGDETTYMARCALIDRHTTFDEGCSGWVDRQARGTIRQSKASEPARITSAHTYVPHELEISQEYVDDTAWGSIARTFTPALMTVTGTTWLDLDDSAALSMQKIPFRYHHGDTLIAFDGHITDVQEREVVGANGALIRRWYCRFTGEGQPLTIYPFHGGDMETAIAQALAAIDARRIAAEEERQREAETWEAQHSDSDEYDYPDYWD